MAFWKTMKNAESATGSAIVKGTKKMTSWTKTNVGPALTSLGNHFKERYNALDAWWDKKEREYPYKLAIKESMNKSADLNKVIAEIESLDPDNLTDTNRQILIKLIGQKLQLDRELDSILNVPSTTP